MISNHKGNVSLLLPVQNNNILKFAKENLPLQKMCAQLKAKPVLIHSLLVFHSPWQGIQMHKVYLLASGKDT